MSDETKPPEQSPLPGLQPNPARYRDLSRPFANAAAADAAIQAFADEVSALRVKHKIPDVYLILNFTILDSDEKGGEWEACVPFSFGNQLKAESMTAFAFGHEQALRQESIGRLLKKGVKKGRRED